MPLRDGDHGGGGAVRFMLLCFDVFMVVFLRTIQSFRRKKQRRRVLKSKIRALLN
jgi:hypothetical protein